MGSATNVERRVGGRFRNRRTRATNSRTSSSAMALSSDSIGTAWRDLAERLGRRGADAQARAVGADQLGKALLDRGVAPAQGVVVGVRELRRVLAVVEPVVPRHLGGEPGELPRPRPAQAESTGWVAALRAGSSRRPSGCRPRRGRRRSPRRRPACGRSPRGARRRPARARRPRVRPRRPACRRRSGGRRGRRPAGACVTTSTCRSSAQPRQPLADRVGHGPADAGIDLVEDQRRGGAEPRASTTFSASMKRASSPPEAILPSGPNGWPGLVQTSNATRSAPSAPQSAPRPAARRRRAAGPVRARSGGSSAVTACASRVAAAARAPDRVAAAAAIGLRAAAAASLRRLQAPAPSSIAVERAARSASSAGSSSTATRCLRAARAARTGAPRACSSRAAVRVEVAQRASSAASASPASTSAALERRRGRSSSSGRHARPLRSSAALGGRQPRDGAAVAAQRGQRLGQRLGHASRGSAGAGAALGQLLLLARARAELGQLALAVAQIVLLAPRARPALAQRRHARARPRASRPGGARTAASGGRARRRRRAAARCVWRVEQAALVELAVHLDQQVAQLAQQRRRRPAGR